MDKNRNMTRHDIINRVRLDRLLVQSKFRSSTNFSERLKNGEDSISYLDANRSCTYRENIPSEQQKIFLQEFRKRFNYKESMKDFFSMDAYEYLLKNNLGVGNCSEQTLVHTVNIMQLGIFACFCWVGIISSDYTENIPQAHALTCVADYDGVTLGYSDPWAGKWYPAGSLSLTMKTNPMIITRHFYVWP